LVGFGICFLLSSWHLLLRSSTFSSSSFDVSFSPTVFHVVYWWFICILRLLVTGAITPAITLAVLSFTLWHTSFNFCFTLFYVLMLFAWSSYHTYGLSGRLWSDGLASVMVLVLSLPFFPFSLFLSSFPFFSSFPPFFFSSSLFFSSFILMSK